MTPARRHGHGDEVRPGEDIEVKVYEGPSLKAPFASAIAEFESPFPAPLPSRRIRQLLAGLFPISSKLPLNLPGENADFAALAAALAVAWQEFDGPLGLPQAVSPLRNGSYRIAVGYFDPDTAAKALQAGMRMANAVFARASDPGADGAEAIAAVRLVGAQVHARQLGSVARAYLKAALARGIPVYEVSPGSKILMYGQGARSLQFAEAVNSKDSYTGYQLSKNKAASNRLVWRLGFPGVEHGIVRTLAEARRVAENFGFPLVVKPIDRNGATGVTAGIDTMEELDAAFALAQPLSRSRQVLVERFVAGDDHRLSVFGGKLFRASRLLPARITGDGKRSIAEIIDAENVRRRAAIAAGDYLYELSVDAEMTALLRKQGFALQDRPPAGLVLRLCGTSNLKTGGTRENVTNTIHPENAAMAEAVARNFRLDAAGIDFITPDIGKSWRDVPCAIIEVNANPGTSNELAVEVMREKFPPETNGRIPSVLVVGAPEIAGHVARGLQAAGKRVGQTSVALTLMDGEKRFREEAGLPKRILGLLLDPSCEALVVSCTPDEIAAYGLPHTRFDIAVIAARAALSAELRRLIADNSSNCVEQATAETVERTVFPLIESLAAGR